MSDPEPIDLSQLQNLNLAPDWVGDLQKRESAPGEVIWGRAPDHERESRGGGQGQGYGGGGGGGGRGPRRDGGGFGARQDFNRPGGPPRGPRPDGPRGSGQENRGPRPGGPGGFGGPRQDGPRGPRPDGPPRGDGPRGPRGPRQDDRGPRPGGPPGDRGPRPAGPPRDDRRSGPDRREGGGRPEFRQDRGRGPGRFDDRPHIEPLPGWRARLFAEPRSLEAITRQVKASGRAYPVFELGRLFLAGRDRYVVEFSRQPQPQGPRNLPKGTPVPAAEPLRGPEQIYHIPSDGSLWLNRDDAIRHLLNGPAIKTFYRKETISVDPPKGIFTAVAVCGFSGEILGPPNHHSFQTTVARLHREQFYNIPIDRYKARIRSEKDETLVAKWLEAQSTTTVYVPLTPAEIAALAAAEAASKVAGEAKPAATPGDASSTEPAAADGEAPTGDSSPGASPEAPDEVAAGDIPSAASEAAPADAEAGVGAEAVPPAPEDQATPPEAVSMESVESNAEPTGGETAVSEEALGAEPDSDSKSEPAPPAEPLKNWAAVEAHFLAYHADRAVRAVSRIKVPGNIPGKLLAPSLLALLRMEVEQQQRFPMQLVQDLCRDLEKESLKFFKRDKKATFVCRTRPHFIEDESHLSPRLRSIVGVVRANPGVTVGKLVSTLAPHPEKSAARPEKPKAAAAKAPAGPGEEAPPTDSAAPVEATAPAEAPAPVEATTPVDAAVETASAAAGEAPAILAAAPVPADAGPVAEADAIGAAAPTDAGSELPAPASDAPKPGPSSPEKPVREGRGPKNQRHQKPAPAPEAPPAPLTMEEIGVLQDLRWLVQEGLVTEFATGELQILGRPPQPPAEKKPRPEPRNEPATSGLGSPPGAETATPPAAASAKEEASEATTADTTPEPAAPATPETDAPVPEAILTKAGETPDTPVGEPASKSDSASEGQPDAGGSEANPGPVPASEA